MHVRPAVPEDAMAIAHVHVATWRSTYRGLLPDDYLAGLALEPRAQWWRQRAEAAGLDSSDSVLVVAEDDDGRLIGFASAGPAIEAHDGDGGVLYAIYLLEEHQRLGIGRRLFDLVVDHFKRQNVSSMRVWVLDGNPALAFYERLGGERVGSKPIQIGDGTYTVVGYDWPDLTTQTGAAGDTRA